jgi:hypothetical protein
MQSLILDGSNLCHEGQQRRSKLKSLGALLPCLRALHSNGVEAYVIFDAFFPHRLEKGSKAAADFDKLRRNDDKFSVAPAGTEADSFILQFAALRDFGVLSNDTFRDYVTRKGKQAHFDGKPVNLHSFQMLMGGFIIPSLKISYLIDEAALDVDDIIAARKARAGPKEKAASAPPVAKENRDAKSAAAAAGPLDFMLDLSPFFLRARDVFEVHRRLGGKAWRAGNAKKTAEAFARECFGREVVYLDLEGHERNDGYFFDACYGEEKHVAVRSCLMEQGIERGSRMLPLVGSERRLVLALLELTHEGEFASGFDFQQFGARAATLGLAHYERYLRAFLWALIASDGVRGTDENEIDIAAILRGEMRTNADENRSDMLNTIQRGILYLMADADNRLPDLIRENLDWMLRLPKAEKVRRPIIESHLAWLAQDND